MNLPQNRYLALIYYGLSVILLTFVGMRGIPYDLDQPMLIAVSGISWPFLVGFGLRLRFQGIVVGKAHIFEQPRLQFFFDFGLFVFMGMLLFAYLLFYQQVHVSLAGKLFFWVLILGYFASLDLSLVRERSGFDSARPIYRHEFEAGSVTHRLSLFLTITVLVAIAATTMSGYSYLTLVDANGWTGEQFLKAFLADAFYIVLIIVSLTIRLIHTHSKNLQQFFDIQLTVLQHVQNGEYSHYVPIVGRDEFGLIARQTNILIDELQNKEKIQKTLGQVVSPNVMNKLLTKDEGALKSGRQRNMAILFCDIRKFTNFAESTRPEDVLLFLNMYFTKMADLVSEHNGIVNKFIGDAILAVYDYEGCENPCEDAFATAIDILDHSQAIVLSGDRTIDIGIGVHYGEVAEGILGSADRYEYTYIGDAVNTASRLDGLSKRLNHKIIVSADARESLSDTSRLKLADLGEHRVRGKAGLLHVFGYGESKDT